MMHKLVATFHTINLKCNMPENIIRSAAIVSAAMRKLVHIIYGGGYDQKNRLIQPWLLNVIDSQDGIYLT